jgi:hypothetical protein
MTSWKATRTLLVLATLGSGCFVITGQQPPSNGVFTAAQAEAGKTAYERTCGKCHTYRLLGRTGQDGELPPVSSLPASYQKFVGNPVYVPPLVGNVFLSRWGQRTAAGLIARFQDTAGDPFFQFEDMNDETVVNITAYVLQRNGAKPGTQPLTRRTSAIVNDIVR